MSLCLIKLLVIFSIFECCVCQVEETIIKNESLEYESKLVQYHFSQTKENSTVVAALSKCYGSKDDFKTVSKADDPKWFVYYKVLATDETESRLIEMYVKEIHVVGKAIMSTIEIQSRDVFNPAKCTEVGAFSYCVIDYKMCKKKFNTTDGGPGLHLSSNKCVKLLKKLGYNETDYEELQLIKKNNAKVFCPLSDMEIILVAPNLFYTRFDDRKITTNRLKPLFAFLSAEFHAKYSEYEIVEFIDGPHRITTENRVVEYYVKLQSLAGCQTSWAIRREFDYSSEILLYIRRL